MTLEQSLSSSEDEMQLLKYVFQSIKRLAYDITDEEFERAQNCQATTCCFNLERQSDRIDETCKNL